MDGIEVSLVSDPDQLQIAYKIRKEVFVVEQRVPVEEEIDEFEAESRHFLALLDAHPAGTARWRKTEKGIKLERFAVLKQFRGKGVGSALVMKILEDVANQLQGSVKTIYLHSQVDAIPLYQKFGFEKQGDIFEECNIKHYKMIKRY